MLGEGEILKDRYKIKGVLGQGAYGTVYRAEDLTIPQVVWAVKEIDECAVENEERAQIVRRFEHETGILQHLNHPGIPKLVEFFLWDHRYYLVMEYIEGKNFEEFSKGNERALGGAEIISWMIRVCDILEFLHRQSPPIIFRDLKPANIVITSGGRIKLVDFGISRFYNPEKLEDTCRLGTPGFCAPEQYGIGQSDARTDVYSFGATLYHILSRQDISQFNFKFPSLRRYNKEISKELDGIILKCLNRNPDDRYQSAEELKKALGKIKRSLDEKKRRTARRNQTINELYTFLWKQGRFIWIPLLLGFIVALLLSLPTFPGPATQSLKFLIFSISLISLLPGSLILASFLAVPIAFILLCIKRNRQMLIITLFVFVTATVGMAGVRAGDEIRDYNFKCLAVRFQPLIDALEKYHKDKGRYPDQLSELVPDYIDKIPVDTGMIGYGDYHYNLPKKESLYKNYELFVPCCGPGINFDSFSHWPEENYPEYMYGGVVERIGTWAYVHE